MKITSALSTSDNLDEALQSCRQEIQLAIDGEPNLIFAFPSSLWNGRADEISTALNEMFPSSGVIGCTGESVVGRSTEVEWAPALSLWAGKLDDEPLVFSLEHQQTPDGGSFFGWPDAMERLDKGTVIVLADPFSFPTDLLLHHMETTYPNVQVIGGMASGGAQPGSNRLFARSHVMTEGAVCVLLRDTQVDSVVSQGCRPLGDRFVVTRAERNVIYELGGRPALEQLDTLLRSSSNHDRQLIQAGLHLGRVVSEYQDRFEQGDFLVRNVIGVDSDEQAIVVGDYVRPGQTVQFHVRDAETSNAELNQLLAAAANDSSAVCGALLFTCNGRGTRLFGDAHHDARAIASVLEDPPLAGFFAQGEIGPVGNRSFMHGFTACIALFREPGEAS